MKVLILLTTIISTLARRDLPEYKMCLDCTPAERYSEVLKDFNATFQTVYWDIMDHKLDGLIKKFSPMIAEKRGQETPELQAEIDYFAEATGLPKEGIHTLQVLNEIGTLMVPIEHITGYSDIFGEKWAKNLEIDHIDLGEVDQAQLREDLSSIFESKSCMGIIARNPQDETVYHARNFDFMKTIAPLQYLGIFTINGEEVFRASQVAGYSGVFTGYSKGNFAVEVNTRFPDHVMGNEQMLDNLLEKHTPLATFILRELLSNGTSYEDAVEIMQTTQLTSTNYFVMSGVQEGTILARNPDYIEHQLILDSTTPYIIVTNFDYWNHDIRAYFDGTAGKIFHPRRKVATKYLNKQKEITPQVLYDTLNLDGVKAIKSDSTIMQVVMNVETGYFNASSPIDL